MKKRIEGKEFRAILEQIAADFVRQQKLAKNREVGVIGIHTRGAVLAQRIAELLAKKYKLKVPVGSLDITLYRDDVSEIGDQPLVKESDIPFSIEDREILLVDDVLYTGRTIRAALDALAELGRPKNIRLAVIVDRAGRELPIQANYVGTHMTVGENEKIQLKLKETDGEDGVWITKYKN